jgi:hypothetical protein
MLSKNCGRMKIGEESVSSSYFSNFSGIIS